MPKQGDIGGSLTKGQLMLTFVWEGDRFQHRVRNGDAFLESTADSDTFDTPVFQEVHQQGDLLFASGMSGGRHWSASIEPSDEGFLFDVACRVKAAEKPAGSLYCGEGLRLKPCGADDNAAKVLNLPEPKRFFAFSNKSETTIPYTIRYRYRITRPT